MLEREGKRLVPGETAETEFYTWFIREKSEINRTNMLRNVRDAAQLGDPPAKFYTNASESTNNILKLKVDRKSQSLPAFVDNAQELAGTYEKNIERAFVRRGDWRLADALSHDESIELCSQRKQNNLLKKVLDASCADLTKEVAVDGKNESRTPVSTASKQNSSVKNLSVLYTILSNSGSNIYEDTLRGIWEKAEVLISDKTLVAPVPGSASSFHRN